MSGVMQKFLKSVKYQFYKLFNSRQFPAPKYLAPGIILALIIRLICVPNKSVDYKYFLSPWYDFIQSHGGFNALQYSFADYTPPYLYWILISTTLLSGLPKILAIKLFAMTVDFVCAFLVYKIIRLKYSQGTIPILAFLVVLLSPNAIYNSSLWGQCDSIYTTALVACVYFLCIYKQIPALLCFGLAISFKLQAMFLAPLLLILLLKKRISWYYLPLIPSVYVIAILPAWFAGRPMLELLLVYFNQASKYKELAKGVPNLYQWIPNDFYNIVVPLGLLVTIFATILLAYIVYKSKLEITLDRLIYLATISVLLMPYILPKMHERYFYPADIFSIVFAFYFPQYRWVAIVMQMASFFSYLGTNIYIKLFSLPLAFTIWFVIRNFDMLYSPTTIKSLISNDYTNK
jgi:Gpi18-like mannosyltransferase